MTNSASRGPVSEGLDAAAKEHRDPHGESSVAPAREAPAGIALPFGAPYGRAALIMIMLWSDGMVPTMLSFASMSSTVSHNGTRIGPEGE